MKRDSMVLVHFLPPIAVLAFVIAFLVMTHLLPPAARAMPLMVGWITLGLTALDIVSRTDTEVGRLTMRALNPSGLASSEPLDLESVRPEKGNHVWIAIAMPMFLVTGLSLIGILPAAALFTFVAFLLNGSRKVPALAAAGVFTFFIWLIFGMSLQLQLFPGILFGGDI
jgi:hypothetical protein